MGSRVKGKVTKVTDFGAFVEIEPGIEGLVHVSELKEERVENPRDVVSEGQEVDVKIIDINSQDRKIALSMKALLHEGEDDYREYLRKQAEGVEGAPRRRDGVQAPALSPGVATNRGPAVQLDGWPFPFPPLPIGLTRVAPA